MKKIVCSFTLIILITISFLGSYAFNVPVYADDIPEGYSPAGYNDQVDAFKAYCKSRNLTIDGSFLDAVTSVTSTTYTKICNTLGIDINELQNQIYKGVGANAGKWYFTNSGIGAMNRIFAEFLQNNDIAVGDTNVNKTIKDGEWFTDGNGTGSFIYVVTDTFTEELIGDKLIEEGSYFLYSRESLLNFDTADTLPISFNLNGTNVSYTLNRDIITRDSNIYINPPLKRVYILNGTRGSYIQYLINYASIPYKGSNYGKGYRLFYGEPAIIYNQSTEKYYFGVFNYAYSYSGGFYNGDNTSKTYLGDGYGGWWGNEIRPDNDNIKQGDVYIYSPKINNNNYEGDTIINNEGDHIVNKEYKYEYPITNPTPVPTPNNITWPTIDLPDLNIDFRIDGLSDKFPFSIPKDLVAFYTLLNTEAQAPAIDRTIPLGFYDWHFEADFGQFEDYAEIVRKVEFIGFVVGLIYITIRLVKG